MIPAQSQKVVSVTPPAAIINDASAVTAQIDTIGYDYAQYYIYLGATDIAMSALAVTESDTDGSGHGNITGLIFGTSVNSAGSTSALPTADDDNDLFCFDIDLRGRKRYLDLTATIGSGSAGTYFTAFCILSRAEEAPNTAAERGTNQLLRVPTFPSA